MRSVCARSLQLESAGVSSFAGGAGVVLLYSYTKRFTRWSHLVLGFALGIAPAAAWIAVRGSLDPRILLLTAAVTFWVGGFDVLYACQDYEFDRQAGLHSIPRYFGIGRALWIARVFHVLMLALLVGLIVAFGLGKLAVVGVVVVALLLAYEHRWCLRPLAQVECGVFYHERSDLGGVFDFYCRGSAAKK